MLTVDGFKLDRAEERLDGLADEELMRALQSVVEHGVFRNAETVEHRGSEVGG